MTSFTKFEDYTAIGVPELWIYRNQTLNIYLFDGQHYQESLKSSLFPTIPVKELIPVYVERAWNAGSSVALRGFENTLQEQY